MKKITLSIICILLSALCACSKTSGLDGEGGVVYANTAERNVARAMEIVDGAVPHYFEGSSMSMWRYYNPYTGTRSNAEIGSVWMYTSAIEAVNAVMHGLQSLKENGNSQLYDQHFNRYVELMSNLYDNVEFYAGTYDLTSYTGTATWTIYGVNRGAGKGAASVGGIMNVYDDQQWMIREFIEAYKLTNDEKYLKKAEYLTSYVLDGWDCALDKDGNEIGGITWGPGYTTKHSCSNGPLVSPLVWLHELYKDSAEDVNVTYGIIVTDNKRSTKTQKKSEYYLDFAKKIYAWQKKYLREANTGVYADMMGSASADSKVIDYETVDGVRYRKSTPMTGRSGAPLSYNSGSMLSGAADLYRATKEAVYLADLKDLADKSFTYFAKPNADIQGHYSYALSGFNNWFNCVLMRAWVDAYSDHNAISTYLETFQKNLDYAYDNFRYNGLLPTNLLVGWNRERGRNDTEGMFEFAFAAEYAALSKYESRKD